MRTDDGFMLDPNRVENVPLDDVDRGIIEEALLWYAEEKLDDAETEAYAESVAHHVVNRD